MVGSDGPPRPVDRPDTRREELADEIFDALADVQRRRLLLFLLYRDSHYVASLSGVSSEMAEMHQALLQKYLSGSREVDKADKGLLRAHYVHLPKLDGYDFIDWNREVRIVTKGQRFDEVRPFLEQLDGRQNLRVERPLVRPQGGLAETGYDG